MPVAARSNVTSFKALLSSRKGKKTQVVLPSMGVVRAKITVLGDDIVQLDADVGGQTHTFFLHYTAVVIGT